MTLRTQGLEDWNEISKKATFPTCTLHFPGQVSPAAQAASSRFPQAFCPGSPSSAEPAPSSVLEASGLHPCCCLNWSPSLLHVSSLNLPLCFRGKQCPDNGSAGRSWRVPPALLASHASHSSTAAPPLRPRLLVGTGACTLSFGLGGGRAAAFARSITAGGQSPPGIGQRPAHSQLHAHLFPLQGGLESVTLCPAVWFQAVLTACLSGSVP